VVEFQAMKLFRWDHQPEETVNPLLSRQVIHGEQMTLALIHLRKGAKVASHSHRHEQLSKVECGLVHFTVEGEEAMLQAGDMILIPAGAAHSVEALSDCLVLDTFSPARDDWQRGEDSYLRC